jgi:hypothetical protein
MPAVHSLYLCGCRFFVFFFPLLPPLLSIA